ncbi:MAG: 3-phosphoshikimate 1-carboxyvinyltransferase [Acidobacteriota bacterium]|nr:3-phosphoshikimate 1-carboxyvinyltransferase [Acidobacteriota bacterium]
MKNEVILRPARNLAGTLRLPGDKSISHRYALLAALAEGRTALENFSNGEDCAHTLGCLRALGCPVEQADGGRLEIEGRDRELAASSAPLDCGNSGSTMRLLAGILAAQNFSSELVGDASLSRRPMARVIEPLTAMGAHIASADARPPLRITGTKLHALDYKMPVASAQVKSSLLFAGLLAEGQTLVEEPLATRDHGELALQAFGAEITRARNRVGITGGQRLRAIEARIPGDISTAAFFLCAAALFPESTVTIEGLLLNPTRAAVLDVLAAMGARILTLHLEVHNGELVGTVKLEASRLTGATISGAQTAALIDELPVLAAIAPYTEDGIEIRDARELRVKESDRITAVATGLHAMGAQVEELEDGLRIPGRQRLRGGRVDSAGDHRIAMAFAVAALRAQGETTILGAQAAAVSYPEFFATLESLVER